MASQDFFAALNPQAVLKHGLLTRYAHYFAGRAGHATRGKIAFIDGYSGAGRYEDGSPGSPLLLAANAERALKIKRHAKLALVEPDPTIREMLNSTLIEENVQFDVLSSEPLETAIWELLDRYRDRAVLLFVDPFGLALSYATLIEVLERSSSRNPIDVVFHFSTLTVARMGRAAIRADGDTPNSRHLDKALGPVDWRGVLSDLPAAGGTATLGAIRLAKRFSDAVAQACGVPSLSIDIRKRPTHAPLYQMTLFSRDPVGRALWDFADMAGQAHVDWLLRCSQDDYANYLADQQTAPSLFPTESRPDRDVIEADVADNSVKYLRQHLKVLLSERRSMRPQESPSAVYGEFLGTARERHVRSALTALVAAGLVSGKTTGTFRAELFEWCG